MPSNFDPNARGRFGDTPSRSSSDETLTLACHVDRPQDRAVRFSETGDDTNASWIPRTLIRSIDPTGKTTRGFDCHGQMVDLPIVEVTMAPWKAKQEGWV